MTSKLDVDEINLEFLIGLDTDQKGRTTASGNNLVGVMNRLENECKRTFELHEHRLDQICEGDPLSGLGIIDILEENSGSLCISVCLEGISPLLEDHAELSSISDDTVVNDDEFRFGIRLDRMAVSLAGGTMGGPSGMGDGNLRKEGLGLVDCSPGNLLFETGDFAYFFEEEDRVFGVTVDGETRGIVSTVFFTGETGAKDLEDVLAGLNRRVRCIRKEDVDSRKVDCSSSRTIMSLRHIPEEME
jgi:hypothetical protein